MSILPVAKPFGTNDLSRPVYLPLMYMQMLLPCPHKFTTRSKVQAYVHTTCGQALWDQRSIASSLPASHVHANAVALSTQVYYPFQGASLCPYYLRPSPLGPTIYRVQSTCFSRTCKCCCLVYTSLLPIPRCKLMSCTYYLRPSPLGPMIYRVQSTCLSGTHKCCCLVYTSLLPVSRCKPMSITTCSLALWDQRSIASSLPASHVHANAVALSTQVYYPFQGASLCPYYLRPSPLGLTTYRVQSTCLSGTRKCCCLVYTSLLPVSRCKPMSITTCSQALWDQRSIASSLHRLATR